MKKLSLLILVMACALPVFSKGLPDLIPYRQGQKWGYCTPEKEIVIPIQFDDARPFYNDKAIIKLNGSYCVINRIGEIISQPYIEIDDYNEGLAAYRSGELCGLLRKDGTELLPPTYLFIGSSNDGCSWAMDNNRKYGVLKNGKPIGPFSFDFFTPFHNQRAIASAYSKGKSEYVIISKRGKIVHPGGYDYLDCYSENLCLARKDSLYCYLNRAGKIQIATNYKNACKFSGGLAIVVGEDGVLKAINKRMKTMFEIPYSIGYENCEFRCKLLPVCDGQKWGLLNDKGKVILSTIYDDISISLSGIVAVKQGEKWAFWSEGKFLTGFKYDENRVANYWVSEDQGYSFDEGLCRVLMNGKPGYIDRRGTQYWED